MRFGARVLLASLGFVPLLAPYELLIRVDWEHYANPFFFLATFISTGAAACGTETRGRRGSEVGPYAPPGTTPAERSVTPTPRSSGRPSAVS